MEVMTRCTWAAMGNSEWRRQLTSQGHHWRMHKKRAVAWNSIWLTYKWLNSLRLIRHNRSDWSELKKNELCRVQHALDRKTEPSVRMKHRNSWLIKVPYNLSVRNVLSHTTIPIFLHVLTLVVSATIILMELYPLNYSRISALSLSKSKAARFTSDISLFSSTPFQMLTRKKDTPELHLEKFLHFILKLSRESGPSELPPSFINW